ncbi:MAG: DUF2848 domain-containing protein [Planctomycetes bacterium]|nr:DUF2848 domain-containing protein [Planctomycetota bacterium]
MELKLANRRGGAPVSFTARRLICLGYTGRDQAAVRAHIEELKHEGVPPPAQVPLVLPAPARILSQDEAIEVVSPRTSGEVEPVFFISGARVWVGVGSDHTDRALERHDILSSKQVCPKVVGRDVWAFEDVRKGWDCLQLKSWTGGAPDGESVYQDGLLARLLEPERLLELASEAVGSRDGLVVFGGTVPVLGGEMRCESSFRAELCDPITGDSLRLAYRVKLLVGVAALPSV